jgi:hypothetical protein
LEVDFDEDDDDNITQQEVKEDREGTAVVENPPTHTSDEEGLDWLVGVLNELGEE